MTDCNHDWQPLFISTIDEPLRECMMCGETMIVTIEERPLFALLFDVVDWLATRRLIPVRLHAAFLAWYAHHGLREYERETWTA